MLPAATLSRAERRRIEREKKVTIRQKTQQEILHDSFDFFMDLLKKSMSDAGLGKPTQEKIIGFVKINKSDPDFKPEQMEPKFKEAEYRPRLRLNSKERLNFMQVMVAYSCGLNAAQILVEGGLMKPVEKGWIKSANTLTQKALGAVGARLTDNEFQTIQNDFKRHKLLIAKTDDAVDAKKIKKANDNLNAVKLTEEEFSQLAEHAIEVGCRGCKREDYNNCGLCKGMMQLEIDPLNYYRSGCPYRYPVEVVS